ncbi:MAG TPA: hypothetical protein VF748_16400 [Candidatus Acidoferrum sp.]
MPNETPPLAPGYHGGVGGEYHGGGPGGAGGHGNGGGHGSQSVGGGHHGIGMFMASTPRKYTESLYLAENTTAEDLGE